MVLVKLAVFAAIPSEITWQDPVNLSNQTVSSDTQVIALNDQNMGVALWRQRTTSNDNTIYASIFQNGVWGAYTPISASGGKIEPQSGTNDRTRAYWGAINNKGVAVAAWAREEDSGHYVIQVSIYRGGVWSSPFNLSSDTIDGKNPQVAINDQGTIIVVWESQFDGTNYVVQAATYTGNTWTTPITVSASTGSTKPLPQIVLNNKGQGICIWSNASGATSVIEVSYYKNRAFQPPVPITDGSLDAVIPDISMNQAGNAVAVWQQGITANPYVIAGSFYNGSSWSSPETISYLGNDADAPRVSMNSLGNAMAIWQNSGPGLTDITIQASFWNGSSWTQAQNLSTNIAQNATNGNVALNDQNLAVGVWKQSNGSNFIMRAAYYNGNRWVLPSIELSQAGQNSETPLDVVLNEDLVSMVIWKRSNGSHNVVQAITSLSPPAAISGGQRKNTYPFEKVYFNRVTWQPSVSANIVSYNVYRDQILVATIGATASLVYDDYNINPDAYYTYTITSVDTDGVESLPKTISMQ